MGVTGPRGTTGPAYRNPRLLALVFAGGALGTLVRALLEQAAPAAPTGVPWTTLAINVSGAFALGLLLTVLSRLGPDAGWRRATRLAAGTGVLGGYTTYSTLAVETAQRLTVVPVAGLAYALGSVVVGTGAAAAGLWCARRLPLRTGGPT